MAVSFMVAIPVPVGLIIVRLDRTAAPNSSVNGTQSDFRCGTGRQRGPPRKSHAMAAKRGYGLSTHRPRSSPIPRLGAVSVGPSRCGRQKSRLGTRPVRPREERARQRADPALRRPLRDPHRDAATGPWRAHKPRPDRSRPSCRLRRVCVCVCVCVRSPSRGRSRATPRPRMITRSPSESAARSPSQDERSRRSARSLARASVRMQPREARFATPKSWPLCSPSGNDAAARIGLRGRCRRRGYAASPRAAAWERHSCVARSERPFKERSADDLGVVGTRRSRRARIACNRCTTTASPIVWTISPNATSVLCGTFKNPEASHASPPTVNKAPVRLLGRRSQATTPAVTYTHPTTAGSTTCTAAPALRNRSARSGPPRAQPPPTRAARRPARAYPNQPTPGRACEKKMSSTSPPVAISDG